MPANDRFVARSRRLGHEIVRRMCRELRDGRIALGLSQASVARQAGLSRSKVGRIERGEYMGVPLIEIAILAAVVGLQLSVNAFPVGAALRDTAHAALLERFRNRLHDSLRWATEVPLPNQGDLRAWDAMISGPGFRVGVEAETRVRDGQALERRLRSKVRDGRVDAIILVLADTRANRTFLRERASSFDELFPVRAAEALRDLAAGRCPSGNAVVLI
jgi:transcriptional regulator with XRE-family HTH domain